jgi:hypothetical protein
MIGTQYDNQRQFRKIMSFGKHLSAHQYIDLLGMNAFAHCRKRSTPARTVAVDTQNTRARKPDGQFFFDPLGTLPKAT